MTRLGRFLLALLFTGALLAIPATPAFAAFCDDAPAPKAPGTGVAGWWGEPATPPSDAGGAAWANDAPTYSHYGTASQLNTYDLGCGPDAARDPGAVIGTTLANWIMEISRFGIAATDSMLGVAYDPDLSMLDPVIIEGTDAMVEGVWGPWALLAVAVVGFMVLRLAPTAKVAKATVTVAWALIVVVAVSTLIRWPVQAGSFADEAVGETVGSVHHAMNGTSSADPVDGAMNSLYNVVLYQQWKRATFGSNASATAEKYAKDIFTATHLTWAEEQTRAQDPTGAGKELLEEKADLFQDTAGKIKDEDPSAYEYLQGRGHLSEGRVGAAALAVFILALAFPFLIFGAFLMLMSYLIIRFAVVFFPALAVPGLIYDLRGIVTGAATVVAAAILNNVMFGIVTAINLQALVVIFNPATGLPVWLAMIMAAAMTFVFWAASKPLRRITAMAQPNKVFTDGVGSFGKAWEKTKDLTGSAVKTAAGVATGYAAAEQVIGKSQPRTEAQPDESPVLDPVKADSVRVDQPNNPPPPKPSAVPPADEAQPAVGPSDRIFVPSERGDAQPDTKAAPTPTAGALPPAPAQGGGTPRQAAVEGTVASDTYALPGPRTALPPGGGDRTTDLPEHVADVPHPGPTDLPEPTPVRFDDDEGVEVYPIFDAEASRADSMVTGDDTDR